MMPGPRTAAFDAWLSVSGPVGRRGGQQVRHDRVARHVEATAIPVRRSIRGRGGPDVDQEFAVA
jgi:hypothetical protein